MEVLTKFQKLTLTQLNDTTNLKVIGVKDQPDGSQNYLLQTLLKDFRQSVKGSKLMVVNSRDIENKSIKIAIH